jgi:uncharacterized protein (UPF0218 family)
MANTRSGSGKPLFIVQDDLRKHLATPVGILVTSRDDLKKEIIQGNYLVSIGDVVTLDILEAGLVPDLSIVDYMTKRIPMSEVKQKFSRFPQPEIKVINPPGQITQELWNAIEDGYRNPRKLRIIVEGEEDLAALVCIALAPDNTTVIYGIPNRGASIHHVDDKLRQLVKDALSAMKIKS